jgi:hypothetical protein
MPTASTAAATTLMEPGDLPTLTPRPPWMRQAACRGAPPALFVKVRVTPEAAAFCAACAVRGPCLAWGVERREVGVWGGTGEHDRRRLRGDARRAG